MRKVNKCWKSFDCARFLPFESRNSFDNKLLNAGNPAGEVASPDKGKSSEGMSCDKDDSEPEGGHGSKNEDAKLSDAEDDNNNDDGAKGAEVQVSP